MTCARHFDGARAAPNPAACARTHADRRRRSLSRLRTSVAAVGGRHHGGARRPDTRRRTGAGARAIRRHGSPAARAPCPRGGWVTRRTTALVPRRRRRPLYDCGRIVSQPTRPPRPAAVRSRLVRPVRRRPSPGADAFHVFRRPVNVRVSIPQFFVVSLVCTWFGLIVPYD